MVVKPLNSTSSQYTKQLLKRLQLDRPDPELNKKRSDRDRELYKRAVLSK